MLEDAARFQELQAQKDEQRREFQIALDQCRAEHLAEVAAQEEAHRKDMDAKRAEIERLKNELRIKMQDNDETIR